MQTLIIILVILMVGSSCVIDVPYPGVDYGGIMNLKTFISNKKIYKLT